MFSEFLTFEVPFPISKHTVWHEFFKQSWFNSEFSELLSLLLSLVFKLPYKFSKSGAIFFPERCASTTNFVLLFVLFYFFYFVSSTLFLIFTLCDFCVPIKHYLLHKSYIIGAFYSLKPFE